MRRSAWAWSVTVPSNVSETSILLCWRGDSASSLREAFDNGRRAAREFVKGDAGAGVRFPAMQVLSGDQVHLGAAGATEVTDAGLPAVLANDQRRQGWPAAQIAQGGDFGQRAAEAAGFDHYSGALDK